MVKKSLKDSYKLFFLSLVFVLLFAPGLLYAETGVTLTKENIIKIFDNFKDWLAAIVVAVSVISILWGAILFLTASGDTEKIAKAKSHIFYGLIGVAIAILSYGVFTLVKSFLQ